MNMILRCEKCDDTLNWAGICDRCGERRGITYTLPYPPTMNMYWRHAVIKNKSRTYMSAEGKRYRLDVQAAIWCKGIPEPIHGHVKVDIGVWKPDCRQRDLDNLLKGLLDALAYAKVYKNDSQIAELRIYWAGTDLNNPRVEVTVEAL